MKLWRKGNGPATVREAEPPSWYQFKMSAFAERDYPHRPFTEDEIDTLGMEGKRFLERLNELGFHTAGEWGPRLW